MEVAEFETLYYPYAVKFCPINDRVLLVATAQNDIDVYTDATRVQNVGGGRLYLLSHNPANNPAITKTRSFFTDSGLYDCSWCSNNTNLAATARADGQISIYDTSLDPPADPITETLSAHLGDVRSVDWSTHFYERLLSASTDGSIKQWDTERNNNDSVRIFGAQHHYSLRSSAFYSVQWNPFDPELFAAGSSYLPKPAMVFDVRLPGNTLDSATLQFPHRDIVVSCGWSGRDKKFLATTSMDGRVRVWDTKKPNEPIAVHNIERFAGRSKVRFAPGHESAFVTCSGTVVYLWDHRRDPALAGTFGHHGDACVMGVDVGRSVSGLIASTGLDHKVFVWRCTDWPVKSSARIKAMAERDNGLSLELRLAPPLCVQTEPGLSLEVKLELQRS